MDRELLTKEFCELAGIKKIVCYIHNFDTDETRYYVNLTSRYRIPKGWTNYETGYVSKPVYPNIFSPDNFIKILQAQWIIFGRIGAQYYNQIEDEPFMENYIFTRINAIKACKSFGGGDMLKEYIKTIKNIDFTYNLQSDTTLVQEII